MYGGRGGWTTRKPLKKESDKEGKLHHILNHIATITKTLGFEGSIKSLLFSLKFAIFLKLPQKVVYFLKNYLLGHGQTLPAEQNKIQCSEIVIIGI